MPDRAQKMLQDSLLRCVRRGAWEHAGRLLEKSHPADIAEVLDRLTDADRRSVFDRIHSPQIRAEVLALLEFAGGATLLSGLSPEAAGSILQHVSSDDAALLLRELPRELADAVLASMGEQAADVEALLDYAEDTAGAIMSPDAFALPEQLTAKEAIERLQAGERSEASFYVYVVDEREQLVGVLSLRQLILQPPYTALSDCMVPDPIRVTADMDQEEVARIVARYDLLAVPVVDPTNRLVGVVTVDDVIDVLREEATEDLLKLAGTTVEEVTSPTPLRGAWIRFPWLAASFVGGGLGVLLLDRFEPVLTATVQLAFFLPVILGMGGNIASQCSMVVVRGLATGRLELSSIWRIVGHEIGISVLLAVAFAGALGTVAMLLGYGPRNFPIVVSVGMFASMMIAALTGTALPLLFTRFGFDPAVASGPFVTTSVDVFGILAFCGVAALLL
jgi:magnesium transporter